MSDFNLDNSKIDTALKGLQDSKAPVGFGLGTDATLITDCRSITKSGFYYGKNLANAPATGNAIIMATAAKDSSNQATIISLLFIQIDTQTMWYSRYTASTWGAWLKVADSNVISAHIAAGSTDHDNRYFTGASLQATTSGSSGASKIGVPSNTGFGSVTQLEALIAAIKTYIDLAIQKINRKDSVRAATTANITLSGTQTIDGVALAIGDRVLVKNQTTGSQNGIYVVASGAWTRSTDCDTAEKILSAEVAVREGTNFADDTFLMTTDGTITLGTTSLAWIQTSGAGQITAGGGLVKSGDTLSIGGAAVSDGMIGVRTINDATPQTSGAADSITALFGQLGNMLKKIVGGANWYNNPPTTLTEAKAHIDAGSPHNNHAKSISFVGDVRGATWSRIVSMVSPNNILGHSFILHVSGTRGSVVYSATFLITTSHSQKANIIQLANTSYSNFKIRAVINSYGDGYIEMYDDNGSATSATIINPHIQIINLNSIYVAETLSGVTTFDDGTTIDANKIVGHEITTKLGPTIIADLGGNADTATRWKTPTKIQLAGDALGSVSVNGSEGTATINVDVVDDSHNHIIDNVDGLQTALDGKAPTGYGLGAQGKRLATGYDLNTLVYTNGWFDVNSPINGPTEIGTGWCSILTVISGDSKYVTQLAFDMTNTTGNLMWVRKLTTTVPGSPVWTPWERVLNKNYADNIYAPGNYGLGGTAKQAVTDWNNYKTTGFYRGQALANSPEAKPGYSTGVWWYVMVIQHDATQYCTQIATEYVTGIMYTRTLVNGVWNSWKRSLSQSDIGDMGAANVLNSTDLNTVISTGIYQVTPTCGNLPDEAFGNSYMVVMGSAVNSCVQIATSFDDASGVARTAIRSRGLTGEWTAWRIAGGEMYHLVNTNGTGLSATSKDLNTYTSAGFYTFLQATPTNGPGGGMYGILHVMPEDTSTNIRQIFYPRNGYPTTRVKNSSGWGSWDTIMAKSYTDALYFPKTTDLPLIAGGNSAGVHYRDVANYNNNTSAITGTLKIKLPKSWSNTMLDLVIKGHTHSGIGWGAWELRTGGYNYNTASPTWQGCSAVLNKEAPFTQVRFAHDGTNCCILLGTLSTTWNYPKLLISEVLAAFSNQTGWDLGWEISIITSETGITTTVTLDASLSNQAYALTQSNGAAKDPLTTDLNAIVSPGFYRLQGTSYTNGPTSAIYGTLEVVYGTSTGLAQTIYFDGGDILNRAKSGSTWSSWGNLQRYQITNSDGTGKSYLGTSNFNTMLAPGVYTIDGTCDNNPRQGTSARGILEVKKLNTGRIIQEFTYDQDYIGSNGGCKYIRSYHSGTVTWSSWVESIDTNSNFQSYSLTDKDGLPLYSIPGATDLNNFASTGVYGLSGASFTNAPAVTMYGILEVQRRVIAGAAESTMQRITLTDSGRVYTRTKHANIWTPWRTIINLTDDFVANKSSNGYQKLPNGLIIQWGSTSLTPTTVGGAVSTTVNFPITFPTYCQSIVCTPRTYLPLMVDATVSGSTISNFDLYARRTDNNNPITVNWLAIGY
jgi:hypothetical protein